MLTVAWVLWFVRVCQAGCWLVCDVSLSGFVGRCSCSEKLCSAPRNLLISMLACYRLCLRISVSPPATNHSISITIPSCQARE